MGGKCVGLENKGNYANVAGNKILSTHTICGRTVQNGGDDCIFDGNVLTTTSRNARIFEQGGKNCIISNNLLEGLVMPQDYITGCGVYLKEGAAENSIRGNVIKNVNDCGIFAEKAAGEIGDNLFETYRECTQFKKLSDFTDEALVRKFDENNIRSIYE